MVTKEAVFSIPKLIRESIEIKTLDLIAPVNQDEQKEQYQEIKTAILGLSPELQNTYKFLLYK